MYALITATARELDGFIRGQITLAEAAQKGDTAIITTGTRKYFPLDNIVLSDGKTNGIHQVCQVEDDGQTLTIGEPLTTTFHTSTTVTKIYENSLVVDKVYVGDPFPSIHKYPAITVELQHMDEKPLTLESITQEYTLSVRIYVDAEDFDKSYKVLHDLTSKVRHSLFKNLVPLIEPILETTLIEDTEATDNVIRVDDPNPLFGLGHVVFQNVQWTRELRLKKYLGNSVFELTTALGRPFPKGTRVLKQLVHTYNVRVESIDYDDAKDKDTIFKTSTITYKLNMARGRFKSEVS